MSLPTRPPRMSLSPPAHPPSSARAGNKADVTTAGHAGAQPTPRTLRDGERELLVLLHGLQGAVEDFNYLISTLQSTPACGAGRLVVYAPRVNCERTHDGIAAGGDRIAADVLRVVEEERAAGRPLHVISLLGFSLGGIYARYAAARLFDGGGRVAGLRAGSLILVAAPNLGVRRFGVYRFLPDVLRSAPGLGETIRELLVVDEERLLERMSRDEEEMQFIGVLAAFEERVLYANLRNDFMVNFGTAALDVGVTAVNGAEVERVIRRHAAAAVDEEYDDKGCKICFRYWDDGCAAVTGAEEAEAGMARRLRRVGWWVIGVDFPLALPIAHNRIVAMSRNAIHTWVNASGRRVVHHLVDVINGHFGAHGGLFRTTLGARGVAGMSADGGLLAHASGLTVDALHS